MAITTTPVIIDTDIGIDIDDTWALGYVLKCPELEVKLITSTNHNTELKAKIIAKFLENVGRADIPIGVGIDKKGPKGPFRKWVGNYNLSEYAGEIYEDGISAMISMITESSQKVSIIGLGPLTNIAQALKEDSSLVNNSRFIGMQGGIRTFYEDLPNLKTEYNIVQDITAARMVFGSDWEKAITPLDTCGLVRLSGAHFEEISESSDRICLEVMEHTKIWAEKRGVYEKMLEEKSTSTLYDTVAIYLAYSEAFLIMEELSILITDDGQTVETKDGNTLRCAISWKNLNDFYQHLTERLIS